MLVIWLVGMVANAVLKVPFYWLDRPDESMDDSL